jgi:hypothetical protein
VLTAVGLVTGNYGLVKAASVLAMSPVRVIKGPNGYGLAFMWGFGAGTMSPPLKTGPPVGATGVPAIYMAATTAIPWVMAAEAGAGMAATAQWVAAALGTVAGVAVGVLLPSTTADPADDEVIPRTVGRVLGQAIAENQFRGEYVYHYTTADNALRIVRDGMILPRNGPIVYVTNVEYPSGRLAQVELDMKTTPQGYFRIPMQHVEGRIVWGPIKVIHGHAGVGYEGRVLGPIPVGGAVWVPIGP